jgi:aspartate kinase
MEAIVSKFGGSSLATAAKIFEVSHFILANPRRRYIVVSAPGARFTGDVKVTDLLRKCIALSREKMDYSVTLDDVFARYEDIIHGLGISLNLSFEYNQIAGAIVRGVSADYIESRGEYLMALIMSRMLGYEFVDAAELIKFDAKGFIEALTYDLVATRLSKISRAVIPGYYGSMLSSPGQIRIFSRGGSDITGAIIARGVKADLYENCTDVSGVLACDPRVVKDPIPIESMTYREVRELAYMGASVLHPDALVPVRAANIPTRVLNAFDPTAQSTLISDTIEHRQGSIIGVAARGNFFAISVTMSSMNPQIGLAWTLLEIIQRQGVSLEHMPGSLDSLSFIIDGKYRDQLTDIVSAMQDKFPEAEITIKHGLGLIAVVGEGMVQTPGMLAKIAGSLSRDDISISMVNQGASEMVILLGVDGMDLDRAIRALYRDCIDPAQRSYVSPGILYHEGEG